MPAPVHKLIFLLAASIALGVCAPASASLIADETSLANVAMASPTEDGFPADVEVCKAQQTDHVPGMSSGIVISGPTAGAAASHAAVEISQQVLVRWRAVEDQPAVPSFLPGRVFRPPRV